LAQTATKFIAGVAMMKDPQLIVSTSRTRKFGKGRRSRKQEGANASAKIQERSGPLLVNEWNRRHDPKLEHEASELFSSKRLGRQKVVADLESQVEIWFLRKFGTNESVGVCWICCDSRDWVVCR